MSIEVAKILKNLELFQVRSENFTWASGIQSPFYCDNRILLSHPRERRIVIQEFLSLIHSEKLDFDYIAGVATAGIPHASILAHELDVPLIYVRSKPKEHGRGNQIEGHLPKGKKVLVVEDLISTAGSSLQAVEAIRKSGGVVISLLSVFDYRLKVSNENLKKENIKLYTLTTIHELLEVSQLTKEQEKLVERFFTDHVSL
ncbi:MAG: orotate phosphoribosyltransferase [Halobacteriovoraceae bacterium]|nr:orotate phosphoribosyltransferase [Halobacteriovoraceae bacterium]